MICLPKNLTQAFRTALKDGTINPDKLSKMSSEERNDFLGNIVGKDNAGEVNALFESKLLLKDQQAGMISWAKTIAGLKPEVRDDIISKINKLDAALNPADLKSFLNDLANKKLGTEVTLEEAQKISQMAKDASAAKDAIASGGDRIDYGRKAVALGNYVEELKKSNAPSYLEQAKTNGALKTTGKALSDAAGTAKSLKASIEFTSLFKQGFGTLTTHPSIWFQNGLEMFKNFGKTLGGHKVMDEVKADVQSRPNALNGNYKKMRLAVGNVEEQFPSALPAKIPYAGRVFEASKNAFESFQYLNRADLADTYITLAEKNGVDLSDPKQLPAMGKLVNSLTGRGTFGPRLEGAATELNNVFFSPRLAKASFDVLLGHPVLGDGMTKFTQQQAAINLTKMIVSVATVMATANALHPGSAELNPQSSNFGKIKVGDTTFNISGGNAALVTLGARLATLKTKNATTGAITQLNATGKNGKPVFGGQTVGSTLESYLSDKLSPAASVINDLYITGTTFLGTKPTLKSELQNIAMPLQLTNVEELESDPKSANKLLSILASVVGITTDTYAPTPTKKK